MGALALNACIIGAEFAGGYLVNSVGLMSDAWHNLVDQGALFLSLYAHILAARPSTASRTFGYHRAGIIVAFLNAIVLLAVSAGLAAMAMRRILSVAPVPGGWVVAIAVFGFLANLGIALALERDAGKDLNIRGAFWHMLGDAWVSFGVAASGAAIWLTGWYILDPVISLVIVAVIVRGAWPILTESVEVLLEGAPRGKDASEVARAIEAVPGVRGVHDLHLWTLKPGMVILTCHVLASSDGSSSSHELLHSIQSRVAGDYGVHHATIQIETESEDPECEHPRDLRCETGSGSAGSDKS